MTLIASQIFPMIIAVIFFTFLATQFFQKWYEIKKGKPFDFFKWIGF